LPADAISAALLGGSDAVEEAMMDSAEKRGRLIRCLEDALVLAEQLDDGLTEYLIERALDEARSRQFRPTG
jgi:hypothetical protein